MLCSSAYSAFNSTARRHSRGLAFIRGEGKHLDRRSPVTANPLVPAERHRSWGDDTRFSIAKKSDFAARMHRNGLSAVLDKNERRARSGIGHDEA